MQSVLINNTTKGQLLTYVKLTFNRDSGVKEVSMFPGMEYNIKFYDDKEFKTRTITALVESVYENMLLIKHVESNANTNCATCKNTSCKNNGMYNTTPACYCAPSSSNDSKYTSPNKYYIPLENIMDVTYLSNNLGIENEKKGGTRVMLLGISATAVKAIIVRLAFFDDNIEEAVRYVDVKKDGIYDISYEKFGAIFESRVRVAKIEEVMDGEGPHGCHTPGKGFVREEIGLDNLVYGDCSCKKSDFMKAPPVKRIRLIVDTSEQFTGQFDSIMLDAIRDCKLVYDPDEDNSNQTPDEFDRDCCYQCEHKTATCDPMHCMHYIPKPPKPDCGCGCGEEQIFEYKYPEGKKAVIKGEDVVVRIKGKEFKLTLEELVKYYLGV